MKALAAVTVFLLSTLCFAQSANNNQATPSTNQSSGSASTSAQTMAPETPPPARADDVKSLDAIMHAIYDVISGPAGQQRDWERFKSLFVPGARLIPVVRKPDGSGFSTRVLSPAEYADRAKNGFAQQGFYESEYSRKMEEYGHIAHVFSTYESRHAPGEQPFQRGINSFQLFNDGQRWWIVTIYWQGETKETPIPQEYLKK